MLEAPYENVPPHLVHPLGEWLREELFGGQGAGTVWPDVALLLRVQVSGNPVRFFENMSLTDADFMLDVVEALLELFGPLVDVRTLSELLEKSNSAYVLRGDLRGLQYRVEAGVRETVQQTVTVASESAGEHLVAAWNAAYGRQGDPAKAYSEAIKAVESAFAAVVSPKSRRQTLGTMIRDIRDAPHKWRFVIGEAEANLASVGAVLAMMQLLWDGQSSRHGSAGPTRLETVEEARAALHIGATLVQFGSSGAFRRAQHPEES